MTGIYNLFILKNWRVIIRFWSFQKSLNAPQVTKVMWKDMREDGSFVNIPLILKSFFENFLNKNIKNGLLKINSAKKCIYIKKYTWLLEASPEWWRTACFHAFKILWISWLWSAEKNETTVNKNVTEAENTQKWLKTRRVTFNNTFLLITKHKNLQWFQFLRCRTHVFVAF